ncbi:hypothetical protein I2494_17955 [Budviciaceae bacterium BWR-B9]|uniref:Uncharacterized protein n=1 Tax=Limnobaculum allomyrinae TaxID=2791986 RepID=A0ABS1IUY9_9GAMM|nr:MULTISPECIES: hypothetical protein [Limnobaculum]MBK5145567.1 hypothetical protein [Limnobaculum allomyrinae]MBV7693685.1 hypothetical protein [Limnobaculum sp. M2-1]
MIIDLDIVALGKDIVKHYDLKLPIKMPLLTTVQFSDLLDELEKLRTETPPTATSKNAGDVQCH